NRDAAKYVTTKNGKPVLSDDRLRATYESMLNVAGGREQVLQGLGKLKAAGAEGRIQAAGRVLKGAEFKKVREPIDPARLKTGGRVYVPGSNLRGIVLRVDR